MPANQHDGVLRSARILLVEDDAIIALDLECMLVEAKAQVVGPAYTLAAAEKLVGTDGLSAAILDVRMGKDTVHPVAAMLAARGVPFVFHSGQEEIAALQVTWPGCAVVPKPSTREQLVSALEAVVRRRSEPTVSSDGTTDGHGSVSSFNLQPPQAMLRGTR